MSPGVPNHKRSAPAPGVLSRYEPPLRKLLPTLRWRAFGLSALLIFGSFPVAAPAEPAPPPSSNVASGSSFTSPVSPTTGGSEGSNAYNATTAKEPNGPEPSPDPMNQLNHGPLDKDKWRMRGAAKPAGDGTDLDKWRSRAERGDGTDLDKMPPVAPPRSGAAGRRQSAAGDSLTRIERPSSPTGAGALRIVPEPSVSTTPMTGAGSATISLRDSAPGPCISTPPVTGANTGVSGTAPKQGIPTAPMSGSPAFTSGTAPQPGTAGAPMTNATVGAPGTAPPTKSPAAPSVAPPISKGSMPPTAPAGQLSNQSQNEQDAYPAIGKLEQVTFGQSKAAQKIEERLANLENAIFAKTYPADSLFDRSERLKKALLGPGYSESSGIMDSGNDVLPPLPTMENPVTGANPEEGGSEFQYLDELARREDCRKEASKEELRDFAIELINYERQRRSLSPLESNPTAYGLADRHLADLVERGAVSHLNARGENPDHRFTRAGGVDAINENLNVMSTADLGSSKLTKSVVARLLKQMMSRQDDREALLAPEATHIGFALEVSKDKTRIIGCSELMTSHGSMKAIPKAVRVGEKIEVSGVISPPYQFDRITVAWEAAPESMNIGGVSAPTADESDEALPYFPPLDYIAYKNKSEKDYSKAIFALKTVGMLAAIAGGMFVPPVALAAPLIIMSGPDPSEPKPPSEVPTRGGVKVQGGTFSFKVPISNAGKEGLYYVTVWASLGEGSKPFAVSRRTILAKSGEVSEAERNGKQPTAYASSTNASSSTFKDASAPSVTSSAVGATNAASTGSIGSGNAGTGAISSDQQINPSSSQERITNKQGSAPVQYTMEWQPGGKDGNTTKVQEFKGDKAHAEKLEVPQKKPDVRKH